MMTPVDEYVQMLSGLTCSMSRDEVAVRRITLIMAERESEQEAIDFLKKSFIHQASVVSFFTR